MRGSGSAIQRSGYLTVLPLVATVFLIVMLLAPGPLQFLPTTFAALAISAATLAYALLDPSAEVQRQALIVALAMTVAMTIALLGGGSSSEPLALLLWFPWAGSYAGMVSHRPRCLALVTGAVCLALTGAMLLRGDLESIPLVYVSCVLSTIGAAMFASGVFFWGLGQAFCDPLTGLTNRAGLLRTGEPAVAEMLLAGHSAVLMVLDVNRFHEINTALGHQAGDEALREFAGLLRRVRPAPLFVGRLGGDEFALVLPGEAQVAAPPERAGDQLRQLGRDVLDQLDGLVRIRNTDVELESTAGIACAPRDGDRLADLLPCADAALATAKHQGARIGVWSTQMAGTVGVGSWELALHAQLRRAIAQRELVLFYQPLQDAASGQVAGVEALVRWCHPERGVLPPGSFLPMAERSTLIIDLTWWELDEALGQCARWARAGLQLPVSANLSARMLVIDDLPRLITRRLEAHGLPPRMLTLEITESALVSQPARAATMLGELRNAGVQLALDDFGTGYSSMEILKALPFDEMKIDKGFVVDARGSLQDVAIVRSVIDLGHRLGLRVVGEGVEDEESARMLTELGVDLLQGDALSPPLPADELAALLARGLPPMPAGGPPGNGAPPNGALANSALANGALIDGGGGPAVATSGIAGQEWVPSLAGRPPGERPAARTTAAARQTAAGKPPPIMVPSETAARWVETGIVAPDAPDEAGRLAALRRYRVLDSPPEPEFDALASLAAQVTDCPFGYLDFIDANRDWFKAAHGVQVTELGARVGPTSYVVATGEYLEISETTRDLRFAHLARVEPAHVIFMAVAPVRTADGHVLGGLGVSDRLPRRLTGAQRTALCELAEHAMRLLDARLERLLLDEVEAALERLDRFWHRKDLTAAATVFADTVRSLAGADAVAVMLPDLPGSTVFQSVGVSVAEGVRPVSEVGAPTTADDMRALRELARSHRPVFIPDASTSLLIPRAVVRELGIASALMVPMRGEGGVQGMVMVRWVRPLPRLDPAVLRAVTLFIRQARHALERLRATTDRTASPGSDNGHRDPRAPASGDAVGSAEPAVPGEGGARSDAPGPPTVPADPVARPAEPAPRPAPAAKPSVDPRPGAPTAAASGRTGPGARRWPG